MLKKKIAICLATLSIITVSASPIVLAENSSANTNLTVKSSREAYALYGTIIVDAAMVRQKPSVNSAALTQANYGETVRILDTVPSQDGGRGWHYVNYKGTYGYIRSDLVKAWSN
ncbi:SH3 domain-containing protein [Clostridium botulinum]|uniref:SH3 domain-containing protein n=1 Tax=Clostridium botulinum TaxID=1491 RepID=UPI0017486227|nr:SH3 domain-containing protein [Clostridium botulinum]MBD5638031.1 SH3 domain-containing protein [Clostridium botulinum]